MLGWYALTVKPLMAGVAKKGIEAQGFEPLFPRVKSRVCRKGRIEFDDVDLMPGYGLARFDVDDPLSNWEGIRYTRGVRHLLPVGCERPSRVPDDFANGLKDLVIEIDELETGSYRYRRGEIVEIISGPFVGFWGEFTKVLQRGWAEVEVAIFGRPTPCRVTFHQIRPGGGRVLH